MRSYIEAWDDPTTEAPDLPTELEIIEDTYQGIHAADYTSCADLEHALWTAHAHDTFTMYQRIGQDVYPDPYRATQDAIHHAADVLWKYR